MSKCMHIHTYTVYFTYIHTYIYLVLPTNKLIACVCYAVHINKGILKPDKSNTLGITKVKLLMHNHDYRSCAMVNLKNSIYYNDLKLLGLQ